MSFNVFRIAKGLERREEVVYELDFDGFLILLDIYDGGIFSGRLFILRSVEFSNFVSFVGVMLIK